MTNETIAARMSALAKAVTNGDDTASAVKAIEAEVEAIKAEASRPEGFTLHSVKPAAGDRGRLKADFRAGDGDSYIHAIVYVPDEATVETVESALNAMFATA